MRIEVAAGFRIELSVRAMFKKYILLNWGISSDNLKCIQSSMVNAFALGEGGVVTSNFYSQN